MVAIVFDGSAAALLGGIVDIFGGPFGSVRPGEINGDLVVVVIIADNHPNGDEFAFLGVLVCGWVRVVFSIIACGSCGWGAGAGGCGPFGGCLLYTVDAADVRISLDFCVRLFL